MSSTVTSDEMLSRVTDSISVVKLVLVTVDAAVGVRTSCRLRGAYRPGVASYQRAEAFGSGAVDPVEVAVSLTCQSASALL